MADARQTLSDFTVAKNYARYLPYAKRREVYSEAVKRMMNMHRVKVAGKIAPAVLDEIEQALIDHEILGSQRALQFGGEAILKTNLRSFNCTASFADRSRFFSEALWLLLCGCGVGFSVQKHHVAKLPRVLAPDQPAYTHMIEDSIEGWADALRALMGSYFEHRMARDITGKPFPQQAVVFDGSQVRPEGSVIRSSSGRAPGPGPLLKALEKVRAVLDACAARDGILRPVEVYDIVMHVAGCVRAGGIRRSATICIFSPDDEEMRTAKTGDWFKTNPQRRLSNNSARLLRGATDRDQFNDLIKATQEFGDPGFSFDDTTETVPNPCVPGETEILTRQGYVRIDSAVGKDTVVWNGSQWANVTPFHTGVNPLVEVRLSDGTSLKCTPTHEWVTVGTGQEGFDVETRKVQARHLVVGERLAKFDMPVVEGGCSDLSGDEAYSNGFYTADGTANSNVSNLFHTKYGVESRLLGRVGEDKGGYRRWTHPPMTKFWVPFGYDVTTRLQWLSGLLDGDGCVTTDKNGQGIQLTSINKGFLLDVRKLLTTLGCRAKVVDGMPEGPRSMPDGKGGSKEYHCQKAYRLLIGNTDTFKLLQIGLCTSRLTFTGTKPQRDARRYVTVEAVVPLEGSVDTYCFTEPNLHQGTFEGIVTGQCHEANLDPVARSTGETGWGFCNLTSVSMAKVKNRNDFRRLCRLAATLGTIQASYDDVGYLTSATKECLTRDALLGVSLTGMADNPALAFDGALLREGAEHVAWINRRVALELGINPAARTTLVKPEGTGSLVLKVGNGVHPHHSRRYLRYVEAGKASDPVVAFMKEHIPEAVVPSAYTEGEVKVVFPIDLGDGDLWLKAHTDPVDHLEKVKLVQKEWVDPGTTRDQAKHMVSNTISVPAHKWDEVADYIWENQDTFAGVALLGQSGDLDYPQAPFVEVLEEDEITARYGTDPVRTEKARTAKELYGKLQAVWKDLDFTEMREATDQTTVSDLVACGGGACVF